MRNVDSASFVFLASLCRYGRVESAKLTGKRDTDGSQSAFVDFVDINSATKAHDASVITIGERDLQIEYNNPDSPTEIHPGETSREYDLPGRIPRYDNRRGGGSVSHSFLGFISLIL